MCTTRNTPTSLACSVCATPKATEAPTPTAGSEPWACPFCATSNPPHQLTCAMCGTAKAVDTPTAVGGGAVDGTVGATFECETCSFHNPPSASRCEVCGGTALRLLVPDEPDARGGSGVGGADAGAGAGAGAGEPTTAPAPTPAEPWVCDVCTFENVGSALVCDLCKRTHLEEGAWACATCTAHNPPTADVCGTCSMAKPAATQGGGSEQGADGEQHGGGVVPARQQDEGKVPEGADMAAALEQATAAVIKMQSQCAALSILRSELLSQLRREATGPKRRDYIQQLYSTVSQLKLVEERIAQFKAVYVSR